MHDPAASACLIDGEGPFPILAPQTVADLSDQVRKAASDQQAVCPLGGRTQLNLGLPPSRKGVAIDLRGLSQVIDYPARDMTITVQAGITLAKLQDLLATENQRLPIEVPLADQATLGGVIATNTSGPRRHGFGTLRDYVIGITVVNDEGQETKAGGRVVKNVAGYDMCKLYIGALGTLGIIAQVTLKLRPLPEEKALLLIACSQDGLPALLDEIHASRTRPVCIDALNQAATRFVSGQTNVGLPDAPWLVVLGYEDNHEAVGWQLQQLVKELPAATAKGVEVRLGSAADPLWSMLVELSARAPTKLSFKANLLPQATAGFCQRAMAIQPSVLLQAHAGNGIVHGHVEGDLTLEQAQSMLKELLELAKQAQGNLIVTRCPTAWKESLPIWGTPRSDRWLMREVKRKLDPKDLFNPGRFL